MKGDYEGGEYVFYFVYSDGFMNINMLEFIKLYILKMCNLVC